jgi:hypothetical protein
MSLIHLPPRPGDNAGPTAIHVRGTVGPPPYHWINGKSIGHSAPPLPTNALSQSKSRQGESVEATGGDDGGDNGRGVGAIQVMTCGCGLVSMVIVMSQD